MARSPPVATRPSDFVTRARALVVEDGVVSQGGDLSLPLTQPARELCGLEPCSRELDALCSVSGLMNVLPVGPACTASWVALPRSN